MSDAGAGSGAGAGSAAAAAGGASAVGGLPAGTTVVPIPEQKNVRGRVFPLTLGPASSGTDFAALVETVKANRECILHNAMVHGAVLFRGFTGYTPEGFADVAEALNLAKFPYVGGAAPRTNVVRDVVFTTNESPPSEPIPFHHEMAQVPTPPSYIMFYCETAPKVGGETPIILSEEVARFFFAHAPEFAAKVEELGVKYVRVMPLEDDNTSAIGRSWKSTFLCETKEEAEAKMKEIGTTWEWLPNGDLRTVTATVPALRTDPRTGRKMFFNSMVAAFTGWVDSRNDPSKAVLLGDGSPVDGDALLATAKFMRRARVAFRWEAGDVIVIDNTVAMHSRNTFERPRRILAALGGPSVDGFCVAPKDGSVLAAQVPKAGSAMPCLTLSRTGDKMPQAGLGLWKVPKDATADTVVAAIKAGITHLDCACDYGNEKEVGAGIARAIEEGLITREQLWVTSKLWNTFHHPSKVEMACRKTLEDLGLDYVDLYLIHFPIPQKFVPIDTRYPPEWVDEPDSEDPCMEFASVPIHMTWPAMERLVDQGLTRNIGVCNFSTALLRDLLCYARYAPQVLQVELHPYNSQMKLCRMAQSAGIAITGFSPLGAGSYVSIGLGKEEESALVNETIVAIAAAHGKSPAQVVLRWAVQLGRSVVFKTTKAARLVENTALFDFELTDEQMSAIGKLNTGRRFNDPGFFCEGGMNTFCPIYE